MPTKSKSRAATRKAVKPAKRPTTRAKAARTSALKEGGPVTLEEALSLARSGAPVRTAERAALAGEATQATVGAEQERLRQASREERERGKLEYRDAMVIMKRRGARLRPSAPAGRRGAPVAATVTFQPLQVMAEGDSWFKYPVPAFGGGIIPRLQSRLGVPILNLADAGDEVRFMLGVEQRLRLIESLRDGSPAGGSWDVLLFSGGGNDVVDNPMALWVRDWRPGQTPAQLIDQPRFDAALAIVRAGYEDLIGLRNQLSPSTHVLLHQYDFAIPDGRGICNKGPWMQPTFQLRGFPDVDSAFAVVKEMLRQFAAMLDNLIAPLANVGIVKTQGTLQESPQSWHNELHPGKDGFNTFADMFHAKLKALFPDRVA